MKRRNYTKDILVQIAQGMVPVNSLGPANEVRYAPRSKNDPQPWWDGFLRYSGRYVHTEAQCGGTYLTRSGQPGECTRRVDHPTKGYAGQCRRFDPIAYQLG